jgi:hypothetical protein
MGAGAKTNWDAASRPHEFLRHKDTIGSDDLATLLRVFPQLMHPDTMDVTNYKVEEAHPFRTLLLREIYVRVRRPKTAKQHIVLLEIYAKLGPHFTIVCHYADAPLRNSFRKQKSDGPRTPAIAA